ncbi:MAG: 4Fe-4S binding protein [Phycisphaerae bacterium]|nr:4Fe-4S binding protein [Phycisphaerae bacterium]
MARSARQSISTRLARWRTWIQAGFLLVWLDPLALRLHNVCGPVFHCYSCPLATFACPIGVLGNFCGLHVFPFVAVGMLLIIAAALGTFLCGYVCPFGFLQDLAGKVPTPKLRLPAWLGYTRYVVLVVMVVTVPLLWGVDHPLFVCKLCPAGALEGAVPNMARLAAAGENVVWPSAIKLSVLGVVLASMFFIWRPWCRVLCPLGAIYSIFNRLSFFFLKYTPQDCKACDMCSSLCKYDVLPDPGLNVSGCIRCLECTRCKAISFTTAVSAPRRTKAGTHPGQPTPADESAH